jgi:hypothetical protein
MDPKFAHLPKLINSGLPHFIATQTYKINSAGTGANCESKYRFVIIFGLISVMSVKVN